MQVAEALPAPHRRPRSTAGMAVLGVHLLFAWALLQLDTVHDTLRQVATQVAPLMVSLVSAARPEPAAPSLPVPTPAPSLPAWRPLQAPVIEAPQRTPPAADAAPAPRPAPTDSASAPPLPAAATAPPIAPVAPVAVPPPAVAPAPPPPAPPAPQKLAPGALRYLVEPVVVVPRLSRRAGEQGTVLLHVVVDVQGLPKAVTLRRSSGYARLDEQAQAAMRAARFVPCTEQGRLVECEADAPIVYELQP